MQKPLEYADLDDPFRPDFLPDQTFNPWVVGSIPTGPTLRIPRNHAVPGDFSCVRIFGVRVYLRVYPLRRFLKAAKSTTEEDSAGSGEGSGSGSGSGDQRAFPIFLAASTFISSRTC